MARYSNVKVEEVLRNDFRSRGDDKWLILKVWEKYGLRLTPEQQTQFLSKTIPSNETVTRMRRKLQEQGKYLPGKPVLQARAQVQAETKAEMTGRPIPKPPSQQQASLLPPEPPKKRRWW